MTSAAAWRQVYEHVDRATPVTAAHYALLFLAERGLDPDLQADAGTVVALLVANACRHGEVPVSVSLVLDRDGIEIGVSDTGRVTEFGPDRIGLKTARELTAGRIDITPHHVAPGKTVTGRLPYRKEPAVPTSNREPGLREQILVRSSEALRPAHAQDVLALVLGTVAALAELGPVNPKDLADRIGEAVDEGIGHAVAAGEKVRVSVNDLGGDATGTVLETGYNAIGARTAEIELPGGRIFTQATRLVHRIDEPTRDEVRDEVADLLRAEQRLRELLRGARVTDMRELRRETAIAAQNPTGARDRNYQPVVVVPRTPSADPSNITYQPGGVPWTTTDC